MTSWAVRGGLSSHWTSGTGEKARRSHCCLGRPRTGGKPHNDGPRPEGILDIVDSFFAGFVRGPSPGERLHEHRKLSYLVR